MKRWKTCACGRFVACGEPTCPFCGGPVACEAARVEGATMSRVAVLGGAAILSAAVAGCEATSQPLYGYYGPMPPTPTADAGEDGGDGGAIPDAAPDAPDSGVPDAGSD